MTVTELIRDQAAKYAARRTYDRAVERHFRDAHKLVIEGKPDDAEFAAKEGAEVRILAYFELNVPE